jgi:exopolysaccharide biosynthesis protein
VSEFARESHVQLAINGDYFAPSHSKSPWDYYPKTGDPVTVHGFTSSKGIVYTEGERKWDAPTLYLSKENKPSLERPEGNIYNAISGNLFLVRDGRASPYPRPESNLPEPRTSVGFDREGSKLILILADGRQPSFSEGLDVDELAELFVAHGAWAAINLDGGGSTTLVAETKPGTWEVLNAPVHTRIPGRERPVANHLGVMAARP